MALDITEDETILDLSHDGAIKDITPTALDITNDPGPGPGVLDIGNPSP